MHEQHIIDFIQALDNIDNYTTRELYQKYYGETHNPVTKNIFTRTLKRNGIVKVSARNMQGVTTKYRMLQSVQTTCPNCHGTGVIVVHSR